MVKLELKHMDLTEDQLKRLMAIINKLSEVKEDEDDNTNEDEYTDKDFEEDYQGIVSHMAERNDWKEENVKKYLDRLYNLSPIACITAIAMELAYMMDESYEDHIEDSEELYSINFGTWDIIEVTDIKEDLFKDSLPLFRTEEDANDAIDILNYFVGIKGC